jgi:DNA gyrase subunit B
VARGKSEVYLKDQGALDDYLIDMGIDGAVLRLGSGEEINGQDLKRVVEEKSIEKVAAVVKAINVQNRMVTLR